jgi:hypothetical protein
MGNIMGNTSKPPILSVSDPQVAQIYSAIPGMEEILHRIAGIGTYQQDEIRKSMQQEIYEQTSHARHEFGNKRPEDYIVGQIENLFTRDGSPKNRDRVAQILEGLGVEVDDRVKLAIANLQTGEQGIVNSHSAASVNPQYDEAEKKVASAESLLTDRIKKALDENIGQAVEAYNHAPLPEQFTPSVTKTAEASRPAAQKPGRGA